jgi:hypothetical protein
MAHQNTSSPTATAQNAATDPVETSDQREGRDRPTEPRSYAAEDVADSSLAPPAAGEVADDMDEGEALAADDVQQSGDHTNRPYRTEVRSDQGPKTTEANRNRLKGG